MYFFTDSMKNILVRLRDFCSFMCRTKTLISSEESILPYTDISQQKILFFFHKDSLQVFTFTNICRLSISALCYKLQCYKASWNLGTAKKSSNKSDQKP